MIVFLKLSSGNAQVGPRVMPARTFEELEDLFLQQLAGRLKLRSRPDAVRLGNDALLVRDQGHRKAFGDCGKNKKRVSQRVVQGTVCF